MEDQDQDPQDGAQAEEVHQDRQERQHEGPREQEQNDEGRRNDHAEDHRQVRAEAVFQVDVGGRFASDADVDGRTDRPHVAHERLGRRAQRRVHRGDGEEGVVGAGRLRRRDGRDARQLGDLFGQRPNLR